MTRHTPTILISALLLAISGSVMAAGQSGNHGNSGGKSASHASASASASSDLNSNGPNALDRDKGKARAADRHVMHHGKHKRHHLPPTAPRPPKLPDAG